MIEIKKLKEFDRERYRELTDGYVSSAVYLIEKSETEEQLQMALTLQTLDQPFVKKFGIDDDLEDDLEKVVKQGRCLGAYDGSNLIGIAITEKREWNNSLWVWDFHIDKAHQGQGVGSQLMHAVLKLARQEKIRVVVCETQNTNVPAINFYRKMGFVIDGIDLSYYPEKETQEGEVAVFMKHHL